MACLQAPSEIQTSDSGWSVLTASGDDCGRGKCDQQFSDDRRLSITLGVHFCIQRDGRLAPTQRRAGQSASADTSVFQQRITGRPCGPLVATSCSVVVSRPIMIICGRSPSRWRT